MKRVLVTGATGFIGHHVVPLLVARGFEVHVASIDTDSDPSGAIVHAVNLMNSTEFTAVIRDVAPTHCLHLAWYAEPGRFWNSPVNLDWVAASLGLYRAFVKSGGQRFIGAGTCAEYDWSHERLDERTTPRVPANLYGISKDALFRLLTAAALNDGISVAWGRIFFLYGPGEKPGRLISDTIDALRNGRSVETTAGTQVRDFMHVADVAGAFAALCDADVDGAVNIASGEARPIREILEMVGEITGRSDLLRIGAMPMRKNEPIRLEASTERLRNEVGFVPHFDLMTGLRDAIFAG